MATMAEEMIAQGIVVAVANTLRLLKLMQNPEPTMHSLC